MPMFVGLLKLFMWTVACIAGVMALAAMPFGIGRFVRALLFRIFVTAIVARTLARPANPHADKWHKESSLARDAFREANLAEAALHLNAALEAARANADRKDEDSVPITLFNLAVLRS